MYKRYIKWHCGWVKTGERARNVQLSTCVMSWVQLPPPICRRKSMVARVVPAYNPSTWVAQVEGSWVQDQSGQDFISREKHTTQKQKRNWENYCIVDIYNEMTKSSYRGRRRQACGWARGREWPQTWDCRNGWWKFTVLSCLLLSMLDILQDRYFQNTLFLKTTLSLQNLLLICCIICYS